MQVSVETISGLERRMTVGIPAERIENEVNKRLQQTASRARVDGFRPGKVPMSVIRKRFGASARQEVIGEVIQSSFYEAIVQEKLNPAGAPSVEPKSLDEGKDFEYIATFEVYPEVALGDFAEIEVERIESEVTDADLENMLEILRKQHTSYEAVERAAEDGDQVTIDFTGRIDGEAFQGGTATNTNLVLGSGRMIPGFESGLVGAKAGETRTISVTFPEDYQNLDLAGKAAEFEIIVHSVAAAALPELNDEFFARFGVEEGGIDGFSAFCDNGISSCCLHLQSKGNRSHNRYHFYSRILPHLHIPHRRSRTRCQNLHAFLHHHRSNFIRIGSLKHDIYAKRLICQFPALPDFVSHCLGAGIDRGDQPQSSGLRYSSSKRSISNPCHSTLKYRILDSEQITDPIFSHIH